MIKYLLQIHLDTVLKIDGLCIHLISINILSAHSVVNSKFNTTNESDVGRVARGLVPKETCFSVAPRAALLTWDRYYPVVYPSLKQKYTESSAILMITILKPKENYKQSIIVL